MQFVKEVGQVVSAGNCPDILLRLACSQGRVIIFACSFKIHFFISSMGILHIHICITSPFSKAQRALGNTGRARGTVFLTQVCSCMGRLTGTLTVCTHPTKAQLRPNPSIVIGDKHKSYS